MLELVGVEYGPDRLDLAVGDVEGEHGGHPAFALVPMAEVWKDAIGTPCPVATDTLQLTPKRHGTDGFFVAVMARKTEAPAEITAAPEVDAA